VKAKWFAHANLNTHDLEETIAFYKKVFGLNVGWTTEPHMAQPGDVFAIPGQQVRWTGALLTDARGSRGPALDVIEWRAPLTGGAPYTSRRNTGLARLVFVARDLDAAAEALRAEGAAPVSAVYADGAGRQHASLLAQDPTGTHLEIVQEQSRRSFAGVRINVSDLARSAEFYIRTLGLVGRPAEECVVVHGGTEGQRFQQRALHLPRQQETFSVLLTQWDPVEPSEPVYSSGNHAGIYRIAVVVENIERAYGELVDAGIADVTPPSTTHLGGDLPEVRPIFFPDPDGAVLELVEVGWESAPV
jgi:catechol 2,3-dioxygenase-like lactoylglutathione lyase family enzyme